MVSYLSLLLLGLVLGMRHATDADHVIAVSTIVSRERSLAGSLRLGLAWGVGHSITILAVGGAIIFLGLSLPSKLNSGLELAVAMTLVLLGIWAMRGVLSSAKGAADAVPSHSHVHSHGDYAHRHRHGHSAGEHGHEAADTPLAKLDSKLGAERLYVLLRPFVVGVVHGLAGSAAIALMILAAINDTLLAFVYLLVFSLGTAAGMLIVTAVVALPMAISGRRFPRYNRRLQTAFALLSVAVGGFLLLQTSIELGWLSAGLAFPAATQL